jgi:hypothetical protein
MKQYRIIVLFDAAECRDPEDGQKLSPALYRELGRRWPQFRPPGKTAFEMEVLEDDPVLAEVIALLRKHGREPYFKRYPSAPYEHPSFYEAEGKRVFEPADFDSAEYFYFFPAQEIGWGKRHGQTNQPSLDYHRIKKPPIGRNLDSPTALCIDALKQEFAAQSFEGLAFRSVFINSRKPVQVAYWQLWADRQMPPLLNRIVDNDGVDFDPAECNGCRVDDECFPSLLRFPEAEVRKMEPFDAALTQEAFGAGPAQLTNRPRWRGEWLYMLDPYLIVSRRFRDWCLNRKLKIDWMPVILE